MGACIIANGDQSAMGTTGMVRYGCRTVPQEAVQIRGHMGSLNLEYLVKRAGAEIRRRTWVDLR